METSSFYVSFNVVTVDIQETQNGRTWGNTSDLGNAPDSSLGVVSLSSSPQITYFSHRWILTPMCPSSISNKRQKRRSSPWP